MVQEVLTYLGSFIRSSESTFEGIMRVRTHFFIIAMREEISRMKGCDEEEAVEYLMQVKKKSFIHIYIHNHSNSPLFRTLRLAESV